MQLGSYHEEAQARCLLCGWLDNPPLNEPIRERYARKLGCRNCTGVCEAGYLQCQKCRTYQAQYKLAHPRSKKQGAV